jgi:hypothetical protein
MDTQDSSTLNLSKITPAADIVALANSIDSYYGLLLQDNILTLNKYSSDNSVLWSTFIGSYQGRGSGDSYAVIEDAQAFIYVVAAYDGLFKPYYDELSKDVIPQGAVIVKVSPFGKVLSVSQTLNIRSYVGVNAKNDAWLVSQYRSPETGSLSIQIQNLTRGGGLSRISVDGSISFGSAHVFLNKLLITCTAIGIVSYRGRTIKLKRVNALLLVIDLETFKLWDYFRAAISDDSSVSECDGTNNPNMISVSGVNARENYYICGVVASKSLEVYHRDNLLRVYEFDVLGLLYVIRLSFDEIRLGDPTPFPDNIGTLVDIMTLPFQSFTQRFELDMVENGSLLLQGFSNTNDIVEYFFENGSLHKSPYLFVLGLTDDLKITSRLTIGSGDGLISRDCDCTNCKQNQSELLIPCVPIRLFDQEFGGTCDCDGDCAGNTNDAVYTCEDSQKHCYPSNPNRLQPGNLYNVKFNPTLTTEEKDARLNPRQNIARLNRVGNPLINRQIVTQDGQVHVSSLLIDNLIINNELVKRVYPQRWYGFILNFSL